MTIKIAYSCIVLSLSMATYASLAKLASEMIGHHANIRQAHNRVQLALLEERLLAIQKSWQLNYQADKISSDLETSPDEKFRPVLSKRWRQGLGLRKNFSFAGSLQINSNIVSNKNKSYRKTHSFVQEIIYEQESRERFLRP